MRRWLLAPVVLLAACGGEKAQLDVAWQAEPGAGGVAFVDYVYQGVAVRKGDDDDPDAVERLSSRGVSVGLAPGTYTVESFRCDNADCEGEPGRPQCRARVKVAGRTRITVTVRPDEPCTIG